MHVFEPADLWQRYIAARVPPRGAVGMTELRRDMRVKVKSQVLLRAGPVRPLQRARGQRHRLAPRPGGGVRRGRSPRLGRECAARGDGSRGRRPRRALPVARTLRARARLERADRRGRARARVRRGDRARVQRLAARLLRGSARSAVRRARWSPPHDVAVRRRRGAPLCRRVRLQGDLPRAGYGQSQAVAPPRLRSALGGVPESRTSRSASTAAAARCSRPTSRSRCSPTG